MSVTNETFLILPVLHESKGRVISKTGLLVLLGGGGECTVAISSTFHLLTAVKS
jgi:hypothetical protein